MLTTLFSISIGLLIGAAATANPSFAQDGVLSEADARASLEAALGNAERTREYELLLQDTFNSLPKTQNGTLDDVSLRYLLHRTFARIHGWSISGLAQSELASGRSWRRQRGEWIPRFLEGALSKRTGRVGASLQDAAALVAAIEDLANKDAEVRLQEAYRFHGLPTDRPVQQTEATQALMSYFVFLVNRHEQAFTSKAEALSYEQRVISYFPDWAKNRGFFDSTVASVRTDDGGNLLRGTSNVEFAQVAHVAQRLGQRYAVLVQDECSSLRATLLAVEGRLPGRLRLAHFYKLGLLGWGFGEGINFLRAMGALDESDSEVPHVIIPNYVLARANCLEFTAIYSVCCQSPCDEHMAAIERASAAPSAPPALVAEAAAQLAEGQSTALARRELAESLLSGLGEVAAASGGRVELHGPSFGQWLHQVFPHDCPLLSGALIVPNGPRSPEEWSEASGVAATASLADRLRVIGAEDCPLPSNGGRLTPCGNASTELAWAVQSPGEGAGYAASDAGEMWPSKTDSLASKQVGMLVLTAASGLGALALAAWGQPHTRGVLNMIAAPLLVTGWATLVLQPFSIALSLAISSVCLCASRSGAWHFAPRDATACQV